MLVLLQLAAAHRQIHDLGGAVIGVGPAAPDQAARMAKDDVPFPLLLDPEHRVGRRLGIGRQSLLRYIFNLRAWARWLAAFARHRRLARFTGRPANLPGVAVVAADGQVRWAHRGRAIGDYPPIDEVISRLSSAV